MTTIAPDDTDIMQIIADPSWCWWTRLHELRDLADDHCELTRRLAILEGQLGEEGRGTTQERHRATQRRDDWRKRLLRLDDESHTLRLILAACWHKLPVQTKREIANHSDWPAETVAPKLAQAIWERFKQGERLPGMADF